MGAAKAQRPQTAHGIAELVGRDLEGQVTPIEVVMGDGLLDHVLRGVSAHGIGEQSQQRLDGGTRHCGGSTDAGDAQAPSLREKESSMDSNPPS